MWTRIPSSQSGCPVSHSHEPRVKPSSSYGSSREGCLLVDDPVIPPDRAPSYRDAMIRDDGLPRLRSPNL
jgi:hypothetical protein